MAGDWIKVEVGTASKMEVMRIAEMLGISRRECMGLLIEYWSWLDANARTESVPNLSRKSLDLYLNCPGFSACLEAVEWAEWDESGWQMTVINYEHHNGSSAKTRASDQRKKRDARRDKTGTRDRDREDLTKREKAKLSEPTEEHKALAKERGLPIADEWQKYRDWQASTGKSHKSEVAGFRNWLKNAKQYAPRPGVVGKPNQHDKRAATAAAMFGPLGAVNDEPNDITAESTRVA